jgi:hypothetical protein
MNMATYCPKQSGSTKQHLPTLLQKNQTNWFVWEFESLSELFGRLFLILSNEMDYA